MLHASILKGVHSPQPSKTSDANSGSIRSRCRRLEGTLKVYCWALAWSLHRASDWTLGLDYCPFKLPMAVLWLLKIETVNDAVQWLGDDDRVGVQRFREFDGERDSVFGMCRVRRTESGPELFTEAMAGLSKGDADIQFRLDDLARSLDFHTAPPFPLVCWQLEHAYNCAETHLKQEGILWNGPPWFEDCQDLDDLIREVNDAGKTPEKVLLDLEKHCKRRTAEIETVWRAEVQRRPLSGESPQGKVDPSQDNPKSLNEIPQAQRLAYLSFLYAEAKTQRRLEDKEAYEYCREYGFQNEDGELTEYQLPAFDTWRTYVSRARNAVGEKKYTPRKSKLIGNSVVKSEQI